MIFFSIFIIFLILTLSPFRKKVLYPSDFYIFGLFFFYVIYSFSYLLYLDNQDLSMLNESGGLLYCYFYLVLVYFIFNILFRIINKNKFSFNLLYEENRYHHDYIKTTSLYLMAFISLIILISISFLTNFGWIKIIYQEFEIEISTIYLFIAKTVYLIIFTIFIILQLNKNKNKNKNIFKYFIFLLLILLAFSFGRRELFFLFFFLLVINYIASPFHNFLYYLRKKYFSIIKIIIIFIVLGISFNYLRILVRGNIEDNLVLHSFESSLNRVPNFLYESEMHTKIQNGYLNLNGEFFFKSFNNNIPKIFFIGQKEYFHQEQFLNSIFDQYPIKGQLIDLPMSNHFGAFIDFGYIGGALFNSILLALLYIPLYFVKDNILKIYTTIIISNYFFNIERYYGDLIYFCFIFAFGFFIIYLSKFLYALLKSDPYAPR